MYLWAKALHITCVIAWMAGMLYLPRLYVYHSGTGLDEKTSALFKTMERRLLRYIINPAMVCTWGAGIWLMSIIGFDAIFKEGWFHAKLTLLVIMQLLHAALARFRRQFEQDKNTRSPKFYRIFNEAITLVMVAIVVLAVVKPF